MTALQLIIEQCQWPDAGTKCTQLHCRLHWRGHSMLFEESLNTGHVGQVCLHILEMQDIGFLPKSNTPAFYNSFWAIANTNTDICTYHFPPNCREHHQVLNIVPTVIAVAHWQVQTSNICMYIFTGKNKNTTETTVLCCMPRIKGAIVKKFFNLLNANIINRMWGQLQLAAVCSYSCDIMLLYLFWVWIHQVLSASLKHCLIWMSHQKKCSFQVVAFIGRHWRHAYIVVHP